VKLLSLGQTNRSAPSKKKTALQKTALEKPGKKRRSRFPVGSGTLLDPSRGFPGWGPKPWLIAPQRDVFHLLG